MFTVKKLLLVLITLSLTAGSFFAITATNVSAREPGSAMSDATNRTATTMAQNDPTNAARAEERAKKEAAASEECSAWKMNISTCLHNGIAVMMESMLTIFAYFVGLAGTLLETTIDITILKLYLVMNPSESGLPSPIYVAWTLFRDIANILLIFALLTIGIATILDISQYGAKQLLPKVLIVAVLLNFSIFFCKAAVDVTNIFTLSFYDAITSSYTVKEAKKEDEVFTMGLGALIMDHLKLSSIYNTSAQRANDSKVDQKAANASPLIQRNLSTGSVILIGIAGSILFTIIAFIFFAASLSLIARFVILIFLTALAPLAFVSYILPRTQGMWDQWLETYIKHLLFAPLYMMLLWAALQIVPRLSNLYTGQAGDFSILATEPSSAGLIIFNFILMCGFFMGALLIAKKAGAYGADTSLKGLKSVGRGALRYAGRAGLGTSRLAFGASAGSAGLLLRNTLGHTADKYLKNDDKMDKLQAKASSGWASGLMARAKIRGLEKIATSSFDIRNTKPLQNLNKKANFVGSGTSEGGYATRQDKKEKELKKQGQEFSPAKDAEDELKSLNTKMDKLLATNNETKAYRNISSNLATTEKSLEVMKAKIDKLIGDPTKTKELQDAQAEVRNLEMDIRGLNKAKDDAKKAIGADLNKSIDELATAIKEQDTLVKTKGRRGEYADMVSGAKDSAWATWLFTGLDAHRRKKIRDAITKTKSDKDEVNEAIEKMVEKQMKAKEKKAD